MLKCKDFVAYQGEITEGKELSFKERASVKLHYLICHNCRRYYKQIRLVEAVAKSIKPEPVDPTKMDDLLSQVTTKRNDTER